MTAPRGPRNLTTAAMILAVSMTFIDQTIVAIASPDMQRSLDLTSSQGRWVINAYLVALAATFALGGRLADVWGRRRMLTVGVVGFALTSILCAVTPAGAWAQEWLIGARAAQGVFAALLMPAAVSIVYSSAAPERRGRTMAMFFGLTGAFTAVGPFIGGHLVEYSWRSIFWINVPVAIAALVVLAKARIPEQRTPGTIDWRGAGLVAAGMALSIVGFAQSATWGWTSPATLGCLVGGLALLVVFVLVERRTAVPLIRLRVFRDRGFSTDTAILFFAMIAFIPVSYFLSVYAQTSLGLSPVQTSSLMLWFFAGYFVAAQLGGKLYDARGPRPTILVGSLIGIGGFVWWATSVTTLSTGTMQLVPLVVAGAGLGFLIGPASADAVGRAVDASYGEVTGVNQTIRNYGSALGMAVLGTLATHVFTAHFTTSLVGLGVPAGKAAELAQTAGSGAGSSSLSGLPTTVQHAVHAAVTQDFALGMRAVLLAMAASLAIVFVLALRHPGARRVTPAVAPTETREPLPTA